MLKLVDEISWEVGNGLKGLLMGGLYRDYCKDPFPRSLLSTSCLSK